MSRYSNITFLNHGILTSFTFSYRPILSALLAILGIIKVFASWVWLSSLSEFNDTVDLDYNNIGRSEEIFLDGFFSSLNNCTRTSAVE